MALIIDWSQVQVLEGPPFIYKSCSYRPVTHRLESISRQYFSPKEIPAKVLQDPRHVSVK
jgi:hypothetical protein